MKITNIIKVAPAPFGFGQISHNPDEYFTGETIKAWVFGYLPTVAEIETDTDMKIIVANAAGNYAIKCVYANGMEIIGTRIFLNTISPEALCKEAETIAKQAAQIL